VIRYPAAGRTRENKSHHLTGISVPADTITTVVGTANATAGTAAAKKEVVYGDDDDDVDDVDDDDESKRTRKRLATTKRSKKKICTEEWAEYQ